MIDSRDLMIVENTFDNQKLVAENLRVKNSFSILTCAAMLISVGVIGYIIYLSERERHNDIDNYQLT
jgi:hypothetical protein